MEDEEYGKSIGHHPEQYTLLGFAGPIPGAPTQLPHRLVAIAEREGGTKVY